MPKSNQLKEAGVKQAFESAAQTAPLPEVSDIGAATYERLLDPACSRFESHRSSAAPFRNPLEPLTLEHFPIHFSALGVGMTQPVEE